MLLLPAFCPAQTEFGAGLGFEPWDGSPYRKKEKDNKPDRFLLATAEYFQLADSGELVKLRNRGYGRNELIKLLLLSRDSKQELKDIVKLRDKFTTLAKISEKYQVDYDKMLDNAAAARKEIDYRVINSTYTIPVSTGTEKTK
jgi:hypothetical protein